LVTVFLTAAARFGTAMPGLVGSFPAKAAKLRSVPPAPSVSVASCDGLAPTTLDIGVREQPLTIRRDLGLARLNELSKQARHRSVHAILGFYAGSVGFTAPDIGVLARTSSRADLGATCPHLEIKSEVVAVDRQIAIASELHSSPCRLRAATAHYERHAAIASRALHRFAAELPTKLGPEVDRYVHSQPSPPGAGDNQLRDLVEELLTRSVAEFAAQLAVLQQEADTPDEVRRLAPCDDI